MHWLILILLIGLVVVSIFATIWRMNRSSHPGNLKKRNQSPRREQDNSARAKVHVKKDSFNKKREKGNRRNHEEEYENDYEDDNKNDYENDYEDEIEDDYDDAVAANNRQHERRWKIILRNKKTAEIEDFIFLNSLGFGRVVSRGYDAFFPVEDPKVSKVHCSIISKNNNLYLQDEGSRNNTFLNGERVMRQTLIDKGDVISLGTTSIEIVKILREN